MQPYNNHILILILSFWGSSFIKISRSGSGSIGDH